uniref:AlNc14C568G12170 protein n=1 Tax=Albugo laibachii Nc14 TaxID=890382 RepID=F0X176_9STRA|nr:AlNc14C568G12170 [Albugo laibachii Nc14]|eukprot:CCA27534.1 AlNc14C568G12170 [Albugo laibachii Nc14]
MKIDELIDDTERLTLKIRHNRLTVEEKSVLAMELLEGSKNGGLQHGARKDASEKWNVNVHTLYRVGKKGASDEFIKDLLERTSKLNLEQRGDLRSLSAALAIPTTTLQRYVKNKVLRVPTYTLKATLYEDQKTERVRFISSFITLRLRGATFSPTYDRVHLDEK